MKQPPKGTAERIAKMRFDSVYPLYLQKVQKNERSESELKDVLCWLIGISQDELDTLIDSDITFGDLFAKVDINPNAHLITGVICGYRIEELRDPLIQRCRYMDKLVDELARGKAISQILREPS
ncbi:MAG: DUF2200 domain-containing protein [Planctomycetota bacterium]